MNDERKMVFVSGPVSSDPMGQIPKAIDVWNQLWEEGHVPILPQLSVFQQMISPRDYETWMSYFDAIIMRCDVLYRLVGDSAGADREVARAKEIGLEIWFEDGTPSIPANYPRPERLTGESFFTAKTSRSHPWTLACAGSWCPACKV